MPLQMANSFDWTRIPASAGILANAAKVFSIPDSCQSGQITFRNEGSAGAGDWWIFLNQGPIANQRYIIRVEPGIPVTLEEGMLVGDYWAIVDIATAGALHIFASYRVGVLS